jgi:hypothetical protein
MFLQSSSNFDEVKQALAKQVVLDHSEQRELMLENTAFTVDTYHDISRSLLAAYPSGSASYPSFVDHCSGYIDVPLKFGHYIDRVVLSKCQESQSEHGSEEDIRFFMSLLSLALETSYLEDRARALFTMLTLAPQHDRVYTRRQSIAHEKLKESEEHEKVTPTRNWVSDTEVADVIKFLGATDQVPVEKKVLKSETEYSIQTYCEGSAQELLFEAQTETSLHGTTQLSEDDFVKLLLSKAVCAWGSCYSK